MRVLLSLALLIGTVRCFGQEMIDPAQPSLGVIHAPIADLGDALKDFKPPLPTKNGILVPRTIPNGPFAKSNLAGVSIITKINKTAVTDNDSLKAQILALNVGTPAEVVGYQLVPFGPNVMRWKAFTTKVTPATHRDVILGALRIKRDPIKESTFYHHPGSPDAVNDRSELFVYISQNKAGAVQLRLQLQYVARDWLFIDKYTAHIDGKNYVIATPEMHRDVIDGGITEWDDRAATENDLTMLRAIVAKKKVLLRCEGKDYQKDRDLSEGEVDRISDMLMAYDLLRASK